MTIPEIVEATGGILAGGGRVTRPIRGISTDSRTIREGEVFFALKGSNYDGHDFVEEAFQKGARAAVVSQNSFGPDSIRVEDTLKALGELAFKYRRRFLLPVVGVTGSNGKTTTKDLIASVLSRRFRVKKTRGNLNNLIGLPLSVFTLTQEDEVAVLEMGASRLGEIATLSRIADPRVGVVTNVGAAHLEFFKSIDRVAEAKSELIEYLSEGGYAVLNGDDPYCSGMGERSRASVKTFGLGESCEVRGEGIEYHEEGTSFGVRGVAFETRLLGSAAVCSSLAAICVGEIFGIELEDMLEPLKSFSPRPMRLEKVKAGEVLILNDAYNSNPASAAASLETLSAMKGRRRIAVLGDMLELGEESPRLHKELGEAVSDLPIDHLLTVGKGGEGIAKGAEGKGMKGVESFNNNEKLLRFLRGFAEPGDLYLIKGSRGMRMEEVVSGMREFLSQDKGADRLKSPS